MSISLAISLSDALLKQTHSGPEIRLIEIEVRRSVDQYSWQGRFYHIHDRECQWFLDIAHNELSLEAALRWLAESFRSRRCRRAASRFSVTEYKVS